LDKKWFIFQTTIYQQTNEQPAIHQGPVSSGSGVFSRFFYATRTLNYSVKTIGN